MHKEDKIPFNKAGNTAKEPILSCSGDFYSQIYRLFYKSVRFQATAYVKKGV